MPERESEELLFVKENFGRIWPQHLKAFTRLLVQLHAAFDGDLELLLVLAVIGDRTRQENWAPELLTYTHLTRGEGLENFQLPVNIQSVADYSGIARETVRRKVNILQKKGWIRRAENGNLYVSDRAATDLENATGDSITYLAKMLSVFNAVGRP